MRSKGQSPTLYSVLALTALALIFATNGAATSEKVIHNFVIYPHGANPIGNLIADAAGNVYGTAHFGGEHGYGAVFRFTRNPNGKWVETILHSFEGPISLTLSTSDGWWPNGGLTLDTSGNLYGTTQWGGDPTCADGCGTVFELAPAGGDRFSYRTIYRFKGKNDGAYPSSAVVVDDAGNFYGTTSGVDLVNGTVFELARSSKGWTAKTIYTFAAEQPGSLAIDAVGKLYGTAAGIFQLTRGRDGKWTENSLCGGCSSTGIPVFDQAGNLYIDADDQVLELVRKQNWKMIVIAEFSGSDGSDAIGALTFDESGNLYGTTELGGDGGCFDGYGCGTAFKLTHRKDGEWQHSVLYRFKGDRDGGQPSAGMVFDRQGNLYGTTLLDGDPACDSFPDSTGCGTVFELAPASGGHWKFSVIDRFGLGDGAGAPSGLVAGASGNLYGTMPQGNGGGCGMVYELTPAPHAGWKEHILHQFKCGTGDGMYPSSSLIFDSAGNLYGTTSMGGSVCLGCGTVFQLSPSSSGAWTERVLYNFTGNADGDHPAAGLVFDAAGNLYGTTEYGGSGGCKEFIYTVGCGALYELSPTSGGSWTETTVHTFLGYPNDGAFPAAALVVDEAGNLYGTTTIGGNNGSCSDRSGNEGCGTIFEFSPGTGGVWTETILFNFSLSPLTIDSKGNLYAPDAAGGNTTYCTYGCGSVYELSPSSGGNWTATVLYNFGAFKGDGQTPLGTLTFDATGNLYGTTAEGGAPGCSIASSGCGTVFRLSPSGGGWTESALYSFTGPYKDGAFPTTGVILDAAGNVYGTTNEGGVDQGYYTSGGTVFEVSP